MRHLVREASVGRLATMAPDGGPHLVPMCFVLDGETVFSVVDDKPKRSRRLQRLVNLEANSRCALLVDRYDDDWSRLWWIRLDARGRVAGDDAERADALELLAAKYRQYADRPPGGDVLALEIVRWTGWSAEN